MTPTILTQLENLIGVQADEDPFAFALCLIILIWTIKQIFSMCYSFFTGKC